jgi:hypothetical protein
VDHVRCRTCAEPVMLDPTRMRWGSVHVELSCAACGSAMPVRRSDPERVSVAWPNSSPPVLPARPRRAQRWGWTRY